MSRYVALPPAALNPVMATCSALCRLGELFMGPCATKMGSAAFLYLAVAFCINCRYVAEKAASHAAPLSCPKSLVPSKGGGGGEGGGEGAGSISREKKSSMQTHQG